MLYPQPTHKVFLPWAPGCHLEDFHGKKKKEKEETKLRYLLATFAKSKVIIHVPMLYLYITLVWLRGCFSSNKPVEILCCRAEGTFRAW